MGFFSLGIADSLTLPHKKNIRSSYSDIMRITIDQLYAIYLENRIVTTDTRKITSGCIFFALRGENFDGNTFADEALGKGAKYAVVDNLSYDKGKHTLLVDDTLKTLQELAHFHREHLNIPVIGITGTNGKTTTKELINAVLSKKYKTAATSGNFNNHIGVPLTLLSINKAAEIAIIEMGANHEGEIATLCHIACPEFGIITNIGKAHLEGFGSFEGVIRAKSELYEYIRENGGQLFVNSDNELLAHLSQDISAITYGSKAGAYCHGWPETSNPFARLQWDSPNGLLSVETKLVGSYNFENIMAAICIGQHFEVPLQAIIEAIAFYQPSNNRSQIINTGKNKVIMDAYNANPTSMKAAIMNFRNLNNPSKMVIIGDMFELGKESSKEHAEVLHYINESNFDAVLLVGPRFKSINFSKNTNSFISSSEAKEWLKRNPLEGYTILVKGSRGMHMEDLIEEL
jgi:UDP-N-acetylmuramoyl-tripeptide--D-alanyl-D-alanine ligase